MNQLNRIEAEVAFLPQSEGGRKEPPTSLSGGGYRPHLVVGDPNQREAVIVDNAIQETYLGVVFLAGPEKVEPGERFFAELGLIYWPDPMYASLIPGATFTIREGPKGLGMVVSKQCLLRTPLTMKVLALYRRWNELPDGGQSWHSPSNHRCNG